MIQATNIKFYPDCEWNDYLVKPGLSFSQLKNPDSKPIPESPGIRLGKRVHQYLLKPADYDWQDAAQVVPIARKLQQFNLPQMIAECGITADFQSDGFTMQYRGMPDLHYPQIVVVDFKILAGSLKQYIANFHYDEQVSGYAIPVGAPVSLIIAYNKKTNNVEFEAVATKYDWWRSKILLHGFSSNQQVKRAGLC